jgi:CRP/FNR family transcriptional regulator, cyclic AMP receptor protein
MSVDLTGISWQEFPLFYNVEELVARKFLSAGFHFRYEAGAQVVSNKDLGETFFILLRGLAKLVLLNCQQETVNVTLFRAGDFFGEMSMLEPDAVRNGDIIAISELEVVAIHKKDFLKMMHDTPMLAFNLARDLAQRIRLMNERMVTDRMPDDLHKVAHTLLLLTYKGKSFSDNGTILLPPLSLKEWSLFCYTSGEAFMHSIEKLKQEGALEWQNQRIVVTNIAALQRCAEVHQERIGGNHAH